MSNLIDIESKKYRIVKDDNGNYNATRNSDSWCLEFTCLYRDIRDNFELIISHPKNPAFDEDVDYFIFRLNEK